MKIIYTILTASILLSCLQSEQRSQRLSNLNLKPDFEFIKTQKINDTYYINHFLDGNCNPQYRVTSLPIQDIFYKEVKEYKSGLHGQEVEFKLID